MMEVAIISGLVGILVGHVLTRLRDLRRRVDRIPGVDAKLDALMAHHGIHVNPSIGADPAVADALARGRKVLAIYRYRAATGAGLTEAKEAIEELECRMATLH